MLQTYSKPMSLRESHTLAVSIAEKMASVWFICNLRSRLFYVLIRTVVKVVSCKIHIAVKQGERTIQTSHPCSGNAAVTTPAATTAHSTAAAHISHHTTSHVIKSAVIGIISVQNQADLAFVSKSSDHGSTLITPVIHIRTRPWNIMAATAHNVTKPAFCHTWTEFEVNNSLFLSIIDSSKHCLI